MAWTDEEKNQLLELLTPVFQTQQKQLTEIIDSKLYETQKELRENTTSLFEENLNKAFETKLAPVYKAMSVLDEIQQEAERELQQGTTPSQSQPQNPSRQSDQTSQPNSNDPVIEALKRRLDAQEQELEKSRKEQERERQIRQEAERQTRIMETIADHNKNNTHLQILPGREKQLYKLLESDGYVVYDDKTGFPLIKGKDKYGAPKNLDFQIGLSELLSNEYSHFVAPRGGNGTGVTPSGLNNLPPTATIDTTKLSPQDIYNTVKDNGDGLARLLREIEKDK